MNWRRLTRICLLGTIVMLVWLSLPAAKCTMAGMNETQISAVDDDEHEAGEADAERVREGDSFVKRLLANGRVCLSLHPLDGQEVWKERTALGFGGGLILFWLIGFLTKPRYTAG